MGMNTYVEGYKPADEKHAAMANIWHSCRQLDVAMPPAVYDYFQGEEPSDEGVKVDISTCSRPIENGFTLDIKKLQQDHPDVTVVIFRNSW